MVNHAGSEKMNKNNKISASVELHYINEHFDKMQNCIKEMQEAIKTDNARQFIEAFAWLQWQESSIIVGAEKMMQQLGFSTHDLGITALYHYQRVD